MSSLAAWSYTKILTIWPAASYDAYGQPTFGTPYTLMGSWSAGNGIEADDKGNQFVPQSKYYFELVDGSSLLPKPEAYIKRGNHTAIPSPITANAEQIKKVTGFDMGMFGASEMPDWIVMTVSSSAMK